MKYPELNLRLNHEDDRTHVIILLGIFASTLFMNAIMHFTFKHAVSPRLTISLSTGIIGLILKYTNSSAITELVEDEEFCRKPLSYIAYYVPVYIAQICFRYEKQTFFVVMPYAMISTLSVSVLMAAINGLLFAGVILLGWPLLQMYIFGVVVGCYQPNTMYYQNKEERFNALSQVLKGEAIGTMMSAMTMIPIYINLGDDKEDIWLFITTNIFHVSLALIIGYFLGLLVVTTMPIANDDAKCGFLMLFAAMVCAYFLGVLMSVSSAVTIYAMIPALFKYMQHFSNESIAEIRQFFELTAIFLDLIIYVLNVYIAIFILLHEGMHVAHTVYGLCCSMVSRIAVYMLMGPLLKQMRKDIDMVVMFLNALITTTSNASFLLCFMLYFNEATKELSLVIMAQICLSTICTNAINPMAFSLLMNSKYIRKYTADQMNNINACLHQIYMLREKYVYMWKMRGIMTDARWDTVETSTNVMLSSGKNDENNDQDWLLTHRKVMCNNCGKVIQMQAATGYHENFAKNAKKIMQNAVKTVVSRQHQFGYISNDGMKVCLKLINVCLTFEEHVHMDFFKAYMKTNELKGKLFGIYYRTFTTDSHVARKPRKPFRRLCYRILNSSVYPYYQYSMITYGIVLLLVILLAEEFNSNLFRVLGLLTELFILPKLLQAFLYINSYAVVYIRQGFQAYFRSMWHCLETLTIVMCLADGIIILSLYLDDNWSTWQIYKFVRLIKLLEIIYAFRNVLPRIVRYIEEAVDARLSVGYEAARNLYEAYGEVHATLETITEESPTLGMAYERWINKDRVILNSIMYTMQSTRPLSVRNVKTRSILESTINIMKLTLDEMRLSGFMDDGEYSTVQQKLRACDKRGRAMTRTKIELKTKEILFNLPWMIVDNELLKDTIVGMCSSKVFQPGEVIVPDGGMTSGVYVILSGALQVKYQTSDRCLANLMQSGILPGLKYIDSLRFFEPFTENLTAGNSIGEMGYLTGRPTDEEVSVLTPCKLFYIQYEYIRAAEIHCKDFISGISSQMWKANCSHMIVELLKTLPKYDCYTHHDMKAKVQTGFVPNLSAYCVFHYLDTIDDIVLLEGVIKDYYSEQKFVAPCYIPRSVVKFELHMSCDLYDPEKKPIICKLLIIPMRDTNNYSVMLMEENLGDFDDDHESLFTSKVNLLLHTLKKREASVKMAGLSTMQAVTQGTVLTKFIDLKH